MAGRPKGSKNKSTILREHKEAVERSKYWMGQEKMLYYTCACCGKRYIEQKNNFSPCYSKLWAGNNHYLPICKKCVEAMYEGYCQELSNETEAAKRVCMHLDLYYSQHLLDATSESKRTAATSRMAEWMKKLNMNQYRGKTFDTYLQDINGKVIKDEDDLKEAKGRVSQRMVDDWGTGFTDQELLFLDKEYKDWTTRYECKTKTQEVLYRNICLAQMACEKASKSGDIKEIKLANDNLQNLLTSANIKPNQTNENALAESNTFGTLIEKWERNDPIPEPDPLWKDVDNIGHYFRVWVLGTLCELFNIKNPYKEEYEAEMEQYTAHKPEYYMNDDEPDEATETEK